MFYLYDMSYMLFDSLQEQSFTRIIQVPCFPFKPLNFEHDILFILASSGYDLFGCETHNKI